MQASLSAWVASKKGASRPSASTSSSASPSALARPPLSVRAYHKLTRILSSSVARSLSTWLMRVVLLLRVLVPGKLLQRAVLGWIRMEAACCRKTSPHYKFMARYLDHFERAGTIDRARRFLGERSRARAAERLDAWLRIALLGTLRHELLGRHAGLGLTSAGVGIPPRLLMEAQLALSPGCDLTCEGCYTAEDRGGTAPRRERIAYLVDEVVSCGAFAVHIIGKGEPFLSPKWAGELLDVIEERPHVFFTIATHAMHINDALAERMGRLGNLLLLVAIDGPEEMHDARRGAGSYRKVHAALARLRKHGALFGFSCMVSAKSLRALTSPDLVRARDEAGCTLGIYSRYFPLASSALNDLAMSDADLIEYKSRFTAVRDDEDTKIVLLDLDDVEEHTGCHSRAGESIYIDGITGNVSPCLRVPFAPSDCRFEPSNADDARSTSQEHDANKPGRLAEILAHPYFVAYRDRSQKCPSWCGANLEREIHAVGALVEEHAVAAVAADSAHGTSSPKATSGLARLHSYEERARAAVAAPKRRLPILERNDAAAPAAAAAGSAHHDVAVPRTEVRQ